MTAAERALWARLQRRAAALQPDLARAVMASLRRIAAKLPEAQMAAMIADGALERTLLTLLSDVALAPELLPVQEALRTGLARETAAGARALPAGIRAPVIGAVFDVLSPRVVEAIRNLETRVMGVLAANVRGAVRAHVEMGLVRGVGPRAIARGLRAIVPLAPNQVAAIANFRGYLEAGEFGTALSRALRDKRFDATLRRMADGGALTPAQVERMASQYAKRMVAFNAETIARTAALDAVKMGQRLAWDDAVRRGEVDGTRLVKQWVGVMDERERETHRAMEGVTVPFDDPYILPDGEVEMEPGDGEFNCRCISRVFVASPADWAQVG